MTGSVNARVRLKAENERLGQELALTREETRIKDARMGRIDPHRRPQYPPTDSPSCPSSAASGLRPSGVRAAIRLALKIEGPG